MSTDESGRRVICSFFFLSGRGEGGRGTGAEKTAEAGSGAAGLGAIRDGICGGWGIIESGAAFMPWLIRVTKGEEAFIRRSFFDGISAPSNH